MTNTEGDVMSRNNSPVFTDDEGCIAYDALNKYLRSIESELRGYIENDEDIIGGLGGLHRSIAAAKGAMDKLGHDR